MKNSVHLLSRIALIAGLVGTILTIITHSTGELLCISHWGYAAGSGLAFLATISLNTLPFHR